MTYKELMKRIIIACAAAAAVLIAALAVRGYICTKVAQIVNDEAAWDLRDASPCMKVVILEDGTAARFVSGSETSYIAEIQDEFEAPKDGARVETWYACDGKGVVWLKESGSQQVLSSPADTADAIGTLHCEDGELPCTYRCAGFRDGWFAVDMDGTVGYIREDKVVWDAIDSF